MVLAYVTSLYLGCPSHYPPWPIAVGTFLPLMVHPCVATHISNLSSFVLRHTPRFPNLLIPALFYHKYQIRGQSTCSNHIPSFYFICLMSKNKVPRHITYFPPRNRPDMNQSNLTIPSFLKHNNLICFSDFYLFGSVVVTSFLYF